MKKLFITILYFILPLLSFCQGNPPWQNSLKIARSSDGILFQTPAVFQDSAGVPCVIHWKGDTLICVFQWFRQPVNSLTWDRVAIKFSYNNGYNWTEPTPVVFNNLPASYQRPFDPTIVVTADSRIRIFFSSSDGMPSGNNLEIINTYSAISTDGIHFTFEPDARFDHPTRPVIDPAVLLFNSNWHYTSPAGSPQEGAFHCTSADGLTFAQIANIVSDNTHNWTGNLLEDGGLLKFYGSGQFIWYNSSADGNYWQGYVNTNITGGDPGIVKLSNGLYLMIYVSLPNIVTGIGNASASSPLKIFPNPVKDILNIQFPAASAFSEIYVYDTKGAIVLCSQNQTILDISNLPASLYIIRLICKGKFYSSIFLKY